MLERTIAVDSTGKLVMESILETKAATILEFFAGLRGTLSVTFEEGTWVAAYDMGASSRTRNSAGPAVVSKQTQRLKSWQNT